jgi:ParB-like nuclease domain
MNPEWPAVQAEKRETAALIPNAQNARRHSAEQVEQLARLITEFGWTMPVLVDEADGIIAGHGRVLAAQRLGLTEVPVIVARGWSEAQKRAYRLADNRAAELSTWDADLLSAELLAVVDLGFDIALTGFDPPKPEPPKPAASIADAPLAASFWIAVEGPLLHQAHALQAIKALAALDGVSVASNVKEA